MSSTAVWLAVGFLGQIMFTARFLVQWIASERQRASVLPVAFWWLSLAGGTVLLSYAVFRRDPVIITGQALAVFVYTRNLLLLRTATNRARGSAHRTNHSSGAIPILRGAPKG